LCIQEGGQPKIPQNTSGNGRAEFRKCFRGQNLSKLALVEFSDFLPTLAEAGGAALPEGVEIDGRSFLPLLKGESYTPREWVFEHYDRDPNVPKAKWPRTRFARTEQYKLYNDGRLYDVPKDWGETNPVDPKKAPQEASAARQQLQKVLDGVPDPRFGDWTNGSPVIP